MVSIVWCVVCGVLCVACCALFRVSCVVCRVSCAVCRVSCVVLCRVQQVGAVNDRFMCVRLFGSGFFSVCFSVCLFLCLPCVGGVSE